MNKVKCHKCGDSSRTLRRVRDAAGKKTNPAEYECMPYCLKKPLEPTILTKEEIWADRRPVTQKAE